MEPFSSAVIKSPQNCALCISDRLPFFFAWRAAILDAATNSCGSALLPREEETQHFLWLCKKKNTGGYQAASHPRSHKAAGIKKVELTFLEVSLKYEESRATPATRARKTVLDLKIKNLRC